MRARQTWCCGLVEIDQLLSAGSLRQAQKEVFTHLYRHRQSPFVVFSGQYVTKALELGAVDSQDWGFTYTRRWHEFIQQFNLGPVVTTVPKVNRNSMNTIQIFLWTPDWDAIDRWWASPEGLQAWTGCTIKQLSQNLVARENELLSPHIDRSLLPPVPNLASSTTTSTLSTRSPL